MEIKALAEFPYQNKLLGKYMSACKSCSSERQKKDRLENLDATRAKDRYWYQRSKKHRVAYAKDYRKKYPDRTRATHLKTKYGITPKQYNEKLESQNNKCAICSRCMTDYGKVFCVDHCHTTGTIRGLLCDPCNYGLGFYEKHRDKYIKYLDEFQNITTANIIRKTA